jgi:hypothetical protein
MNTTMNKIKKYWKLIISVGVLATIALGVSGYIALAPFGGDKTINAIKYEYDNGTVFSGDGQVNKDQFKTFVRDLNYQFVQTKFDIFKPVYSLVRAQYYPKDNLSDDKKVHNVISIYLERKGLLEWKVVDTKDSSITGLSFTDTVNLASQYDLTTSFPGKDQYKITNYPPLTPQEIESNRKLREGEEAVKANQKIQQDLKQQFDNSSKEEKVKVLNENITRRQGYIDNYNTNKVFPPNVTEPDIAYYLEYLKKGIEMDKQQLIELQK